MISVKTEGKNIVITIDSDGAEYIADIMAEEASRSRDKGAVDISESIYEELEKSKKTDE